jgi:hypothetical protein
LVCFEGFAGDSEGGLAPFAGFALHFADTVDEREDGFVNLEGNAGDHGGGFVDDENGFTYLGGSVGDYEDRLDDLGQSTGSRVYRSSTVVFVSEATGKVPPDRRVRSPYT